MVSFWELSAYAWINYQWTCRCSENAAYQSFILLASVKVLILCGPYGVTTYALLTNRHSCTKSGCWHCILFLLRKSEVLVNFYFPISHVLYKSKTCIVCVNLSYNNIAALSLTYINAINCMRQLIINLRSSRNVQTFTCFYWKWNV